MHDVFAGSYPLKAGRAHEVIGQSSTTFAAIACHIGIKDSGRVALWLIEDWRGDQLNPQGLAPFCDPRNLLMVRVPDQKAMQACAEEALRSGAVSVVVAEIARPLSFTAGRRLQLAAEEGNATGVLLIGEHMGNNAAESRWNCSPLCQQFSPSIIKPGTPDSTLQRWQLIKNKSGTLGYWDIIWDAETRRVIVVSETGERPNFAAAVGDDALCAHVAAE